MFLRLKQFYGRHKRWCRIGVGLVLLYTLAGFLGAPMAIHYALKNQVSPVLNRDVRVKSVRFNPYSFSLRLAGVSISDSGDTPLIQLNHLYVNVDPLISVFKWGIVVKSVEMAAPKINVVRTGANQFNFSDIVSPSEKQGTEENDSPSKPVRLVLKAFNLTDGEIRFVDKAQPHPFDTKISAVTIGLHQFDTRPDAPPATYEISARTESKEILAISGEFDLTPISVLAAIRLDGLPLAKYAPYYGKVFNAKVAHGTLGLQADAQWSEDVQSVGDIGVTLSQLALNSKDGAPLAAIERIKVAGAFIDLKKRHANLGQVNTSKGKIDIQMDGAGRLNFQKVFAPASSERRPPSKPNHKAPAAEVPEWIVELPEFELKNYRVRYEDKQTDPKADIILSDINVDAKDISTRKDARGNVALTLSWPDSGTLGIQGAVGVMPLFTELGVEAKALDLRPLQPFINPHVRLVVTNGLFDTNGKIKMDAKADPMDIQYTGIAAINELKTVDKENTQDFLNWKSLYLEGLEFGSAPFRLNIEEVALTDFYNRLIINADGSSNFAAIISKKEEVPRGGQKEQDATEDNSSPDESGGGQIKIKTVTLQGGKVDFSDFFIKPNVRLPMSKIAGRVSGLDTLKENRAEVLLKGIVGQNVPLEIKGRINPLIQKPFVDLVIGLKGVDLSPFTPYSGKYLGYKLEKGQLSLDLAYQVENNKLTARNKVMLNQLTLGDTVESPTATKLPIKLALALLKDRQGNIDLDLPMTGDLDDPEFSIGGIIVKMLGNLVVNIVSSPFSVLGALFGGGEELAYLDFELGKSDIAEENFEKLETLTKILYERPTLKMEIQGQVDPEGDIDGMRRTRFESQLRSMKLKKMISKGQKAMPLAQIEVAGKEREKMVRKLFAAGQLPKPRDEKGKLKKLDPSQMEQLLYTAIAIRKDDLRLLAQQRSLAAKNYLVDHGQVDVERLFIVEPKIDTADVKSQSKSQVLFNLK